eukprot:403352349
MQNPINDLEYDNGSKTGNIIIYDLLTNKYHKHMQCREGLVFKFCIIGHIKKYLAGVVGLNQDRIYVWSMKSTMDQQRPQRFKHKIIFGERVTQVISHKASLNRYLIVGKANGSIDIIEVVNFQRVFEVKELMNTSIHHMSECKRGSNFIGNVIVASEDNNIKMIKLNFIIKQIEKVELDYVFPDKIDSAISLSGDLICIHLSSGFINIFDLGLLGNQRQKPFLIESYKDTSHMFGFNKGNYFVKVFSGNNKNEQFIQLFGGKTGKDINVYKTQIQSKIIAIVKILDMIVIAGKHDGKIQIFHLDFDDSNQLY